MKETGRDKSADRDFESFLSQFRRKPAPAGLKDRILHRLEERKPSDAVFSPAMRRAAIFCLIFIALLLSVELIITRSETRRIQELCLPSALNARQTIEDESNSIEAEWPGLSTYEKSLFSLRSAGKKTAERGLGLGPHWQIKILMEELNGS